MFVDTIVSYTRTLEYDVTDRYTVAMLQSTLPTDILETVFRGSDYKNIWGAYFLPYLRIVDKVHCTMTVSYNEDNRPIAIRLLYCPKDTVLDHTIMDTNILFSDLPMVIDGHLIDGNFEGYWKAYRWVSDEGKEVGFEILLTAPTTTIRLFGPFREFHPVGIPSVKGYYIYKTKTAYMLLKEPVLHSGMERKLKRTAAQVVMGDESLWVTFNIVDFGDENQIVGTYTCLLNYMIRE